MIQCASCKLKLRAKKLSAPGFSGLIDNTHLNNHHPRQQIYWINSTHYSLAHLLQYTLFFIACFIPYCLHLATLIHWPVRHFQFSYLLPDHMEYELWAFFNVGFFLSQCVKLLQAILAFSNLIPKFPLKFFHLGLKRMGYFLQLLFLQAHSLYLVLKLFVLSFEFLSQ